MNTYPGQGLTIGTAILGSTVGQAYPAGTAFIFCKIYGKILTVEGEPVGEVATELANDINGKLVPVSGWRGVTVSAGITANVDSAGSIISTKKIDTQTNEYGYFEFHVIRGLVVTVYCPAIASSISVNTTGLTSIDVSTLL